MLASTSFFGCKIPKTAGAIIDPVDISELLATIQVLKPKPSPYALIRVGGTGDGAYLIPDDLSGIKACFSPGVANFKNFEDQLSDQYGISCHMCDMSSDLAKFRTPLRAGLQTFKKSWLDVIENDDCITLENWVRELAPGSQDDLLLQIDIEGAEYRNLLQTPDSTLKRFGIIVIELHHLSRILDPSVFRNVFKPLFEKLNSMFVCVHAHPNNCCGDIKIPDTELNMPSVHELTFVGRNRMNAAMGRELYAPLLPHPQDISRNVAGNAPLVLSRAWSDGIRAPESHIKMLEDELDYLRQQKQEKVEAEAAAASMYAISQEAYVDVVARHRQVWPGEPELVEVALGKPFVLSSAFAHFAKSGNVSEKEAFFFHTDYRAGQSITVDLEESYCVCRIRIRNRSDGFHGRAKYLFYVLHESPEREKSPIYPLSVDDDFLKGRSLQCDTPVPCLRARFLTILSIGTTALHFSALQVFAASSAATPL